MSILCIWICGETLHTQFWVCLCVKWCATVQSVVNVKYHTVKASPGCRGSVWYPPMHSARWMWTFSITVSPPLLLEARPWYLYENNQKDALYRLIYYSKSDLHVSGDVFAHHQEHLTVFTVSGSVYPSCCRLPAGSNLGEHYQIP